MHAFKSTVNAHSLHLLYFAWFVDATVCKAICWWSWGAEFTRDCILLQAPEEKIENSVKEHMVHELTAGSSSKDVTRATALRR